MYMLYVVSTKVRAKRVSNVIFLSRMYFSIEYHTPDLSHSFHLTSKVRFPSFIFLTSELSSNSCSILQPHLCLPRHYSRHVLSSAYFCMIRHSTVLAIMSRFVFVCFRLWRIERLTINLAEIHFL